jgi:hypothetical protein
VESIRLCDLIKEFLLFATLALNSSSVSVPDFISSDNHKEASSYRRMPDFAGSDHHLCRTSNAWHAVGLAEVFSVDEY